MKKTNIYSGIYLALMAGLILQSCSESTQEAIPENSENTVIFEDLELLDNVSKSPLENHIYRIEILGNNEEAEDIVARIEAEGQDLDKLNIYGIEKSYLNNSEIIVYAIPYHASEDLLVIYKYGDKYQISQAEFRVERNNSMHFRLNTMDGKLFYGMNVNNENQIEEIVHSDNEIINTFNDEIYYSEKDNHREMQVKTKDPSCCRKADSYSGCLTCTTEYFEDSTIGKVAFTIIGRSFFIAIGVSCIGAGPSAVC